MDNERADTFAKKGTTIWQAIDQPISFYTMKTLIRREFTTSRSNESKARTKEKQWTSALSNIADWPRLESVAGFRLRTGHNCLAKPLHRIGLYAQTTCSLREEMEKTHLIQCPAPINTNRNSEILGSQKSINGLMINIIKPAI
nr:hypothetical transcript [Hymenolepis microstoma]